MNALPVSALSFAILLAGALPSRADRYERGLHVYQAFCTNCHSVGWQSAGASEKNRVDLTRVVDRRSNHQLKSWLKEPKRQKSDTPCLGKRKLTDEQIDDLIAFFQTRAAPPPRQVRPGGSGQRIAEPVVHRPAKGQRQ